MQGAFQKRKGDTSGPYTMCRELLTFQGREHVDVKSGTLTVATTINKRVWFQAGFSLFNPALSNNTPFCTDFN